MRTIIKNGAVVAAQKIRSIDLLIDGGVIAKIGTVKQRAGDVIFDASGAFVLPGLIDMHTHLREPGFEYKEDIASGTLAAVRGGYTTVCAMPNTGPVVDNSALVRFVANRQAHCRVLPIGAITKGSAGTELAEMGLMKEAGAIAFSDDGQPVENANIMRLALEYARGHDALIISHAEDKTLSGGGLVNEGYHATVAGLKGIPSSSEEVAIARDCILAERAGARIHIAHVSTRGSVGIIRAAKARGVRVTAETCPHYFALTDAEILNYNTCAKINPPLRTEDDRLAVIEGILDGTIDVIATDHAPHHDDEKNKEFAYAPFGSVGLETAFAVGYTYLTAAGIDIVGLSRLYSGAAARILGISGGELIEGAAADITVFDPSIEYIVNKNNLIGKSHNTVFDGKKLHGAITATFAGGKHIVCN